MRTKLSLLMWSALCLAVASGAWASPLEVEVPADTVRASLQKMDPSARASQSIGLCDAVEAARQNNKQLRASQTDRELYRLKVTEALSGNFPQLDAKLTATTMFNQKMDMGGFPVELPNSVTFGLTASWTFNMQQVMGVKVSKIARRLMDVGIEQTEQDVVANISDTYYGVLTYERNKKIVEANLREMEDIAKHTQRSYEVGAAEKTDVDQIMVTVAQLKSTLLSVERGLQSTKMLLVLQMGIDINTEVNVTDHIDALVESILRATPAGVDTAQMDINNNLQLRQIEMNQQLLEKQKRLSAMAYVPYLTAAYQFNQPIGEAGFMNMKHTGNIILNIPLFSGLKRTSQYKQSKVDIERTAINRSLLEDNLVQNAEQYAFEMQNAIDAYQVQVENLAVAKGVLQNYRTKFDHGALSALDLTQANVNYLSAESSYASACMDVLTATTKLRALYNDMSQCPGAPAGEGNTRK